MTEDCALVYHTVIHHSMYPNNTYIHFSTLGFVLLIVHGTDHMHEYSFFLLAGSICPTWACCRNPTPRNAPVSGVLRMSSPPLPQIQSFRWILYTSLNVKPLPKSGNNNWLVWCGKCHPVLSSSKSPTRGTVRSPFLNSAAGSTQSTSVLGDV